MQALNRRSIVTGLGAAGLTMGLGGNLAVANAALSKRRPFHGGHASLLAQCIAECTECYQVCQETLQHCLEVGGEHVNPTHMRLLLDCIEICKSSIDFMTNRSDFHKQICAICAQICEKCADSCDKLSTGDDQMKTCADICRKCAKTCLRMAAA